jgi:hypothetical protein
MTKAEKILNNYIKVDINNMSEENRNYFSITLNTALKAINKALRQNVNKNDTKNN